MNFSSIDLPIDIFEDIENDPHPGVVCLQPGSYGVDGNLSRLFIREMKFAGGNAAKGYGVKLIPGCDVQAGTVAAGQL